ncbi:MAG: DUF3047 domain-containing protein [Gammaproteobacteria bacterium]|nr:DUF3047 domain-containing protein [Gammaproteobacteria bacterium]
MRITTFVFVCLLSLPMPLAWADQPESLAVLDTELIIDNKPTPHSPDRPGEIERAGYMTDHIRKAFELSGVYELVSLEGAAATVSDLQDSVSNLHNCKSCISSIGQELDVDYVATVWVQVVSNLIINFNMVLRDGQTGEVVKTSFIDIRGNNNRTWRSGTNYLLKKFFNEYHAEIPGQARSRPAQSGLRNRMKLSVALLLLPFLTAAADVAVGDFDSNGLHQWQNKSFEGETRYELVMDDGRQVVRAESDGTASGLYREQTIDLTRTPWLRWRWKVANVLEGVDETTKSGDDYPARVYVVFSGGLAFWRTRTIVYVWSSNQSVGSEWRSAFTDKARIIAVQGGKGRVGEWVTESRNVREDYHRLFGDDAEKADAVAIMTDTDNSGQSAVAWYADIRFSDQP